MISGGRRRYASVSTKPLTLVRRMSASVPSPRRMNMRSIVFSSVTLARIAMTAILRRPLAVLGHHPPQLEPPEVLACLTGYPLGG